MIINSYNHPVILSFIAQCARIIDIRHLAGGYQRGRAAGAKVNVIGYGVIGIGVPSCPDQYHGKTLTICAIGGPWKVGLVWGPIANSSRSEAVVLTIACAIAYSLGSEVIGDA